MRDEQSPDVRESKTALDSGFSARRGFRMDSSICPDSGLYFLVGFWIPLAVFRIPKPRIQDSTSKIFRRFRIPQLSRQKLPGLP